MIRVLVACLFLPTFALAQNNDWAKAIAAVTKTSDAYIEYGLRELGSGSVQQAVGVAGVFTDIEKHRCAILGRMLGQIDVISELETFDYPPLKDRPDPFEAVEIGVSLSNWVGEAKTALAQTETERINTWNLDCVGTLVPQDAYVASPAPQADIAADGTTIIVYGDIDRGMYDRFMGVLRANPDTKSVALGSGGGSVKDAIEMGREIRKRGLDTVLEGNCYSACPLVFVGGTERTVWAAVRHDFGFHRLAVRGGTVLPDDHAFYGLIADYLSEMGVDAETYIGWMHSAAPEEMYNPQPVELCKPMIATFVQRICSNGKIF